MKKIVFIKSMEKYPGNEALRLDIPQGAEYPLENSDTLQLRLNNSQISGTVFVSVNTILNVGYAKVVNN